MAEKKNLFSDKGRIRGPHLRILHWKAAGKVKRPCRLSVTNTIHVTEKCSILLYGEIADDF